MKNKVSADSGNHDEVDENNLINKEFLVTILLTNKNTAMDTENEINNIMNRNKELVKVNVTFITQITIWWFKKWIVVQIYSLS